MDFVKILTDLVRAIARPAISIIFAAVIAQVVVEGIAVPEWFLALAGTCILWWFGERAITHAKANSTATSIDVIATKIAAAVKSKADES